MAIQNLNNSSTVQHRIMTTFPNVTKWKNYQLVLSNLVAFFDGEKIRLNEGWSRCRGHSSLCANSEGRKVLKILKSVDVRVQFGNDAPRGGAVGAYFKCLRKNANAVAFFRELIAEAKTK